MDLAAIGAISIGMHQAETQQAVNVSLLKKTMDSQEAQALNLIDNMMPAQSFGHQLDVLV